MYKNPQNICGLCQKLLCCVQCKRKHQLEQHPDSDYNPECPLCNNGSMVRYPNPDNDLVAHIKQHHLPLGCIKCAVIVEHGEDFLKLDGSCLLVPVALPAPTIEITHPDVEKSQNFKETKETTPKSKFNLKGPNSLAKCASTSFLSTQVTTTRLVRTCSTPTTQEMVSIQFMNGTHSSQMSSICNQSSEITSNSPGVFALGGTPMAPKVDKFKIPAQQKLRFKGSNVTPLRQVMSQNVQRALLNHDLMTQRSPQPLDLRTKRRSFGGSFENEDIPEVQEVGPEDPPEHKCEKTKEVVVSSTECVVPIGSESGEKEDQIVNSHTETNLDESDDIFYSPIPLRNRRRRRSSIYTCVRLEEYSEEFSSDLVTATTREFTATYDEVSADPLPVAATQQPENKVSLWNVLSSVLRFASGSLMPRAVSNGHGGLEDSEESVNIVSKRRTPSSPGPAQSPRQSPKRTRFQGRRPIARCRELSDK